MSTNAEAIEVFKGMIQEKLPKYKTLDQTIEAIKREMEVISGGLSPEAADQLREAGSLMHQEQSLVEENLYLVQPSLLDSEEEMEEWYRPSLTSGQHWPALKNWFFHGKEWNRNTIDSIDSQSSNIVARLGNPKSNDSQRMGLILGHVQSGKTANMTAVIAKAADAGYNLVIVLAGVTNKLRSQTQGRLEQDLTSHNHALWVLETRSGEEEDFDTPASGKLTIPGGREVRLIVIKKVASRLEALYRTISDTPPGVLRKYRVLVIDDECDQASVNTSATGMTTINERIRRIIDGFPAVSYVGYTATPFANVFIDPHGGIEKGLRDLYPRHFIYALPKPKEYFGLEEVFGKDPLDAEKETRDEAGLDLIRSIPACEHDRLITTRRNEKDTFQPEVTASLRDALHWFIASCIIRETRGQQGMHMSMLVHTSAFIEQHSRMESAIKNYLRSTPSEVLADRVLALVEAEQKLARDALEAYGEPWPSAEEIARQVPAMNDRLEVIVENSESLNRMNFDRDKPARFIVIGGAVLARGLTLEGLSASFFMRTTTRQYDSLMQMGRWFGFRPGYEDLLRLWTTDELAANFRALARIEEEVREDIEVYSEKQCTPLDLAVRVRRIPGMAITSAGKMGAAEVTGISYEGRHLQTFRFDHKNEEVVQENLKAAARLIEKVGKESFSRKARGLLAENIPAHRIRSFLSKYSISDRHIDLQQGYLIRFMDSAEERWGHWNLGIIQPRSSGRTLGSRYAELSGLKTIQRARLRSLVDGQADIKALMSRLDILLDAGTEPEDASKMSWAQLKMHRPQCPLLLLYFIDAESPPRRVGGGRVSLDAVDDLVGIGLVFPGEPNTEGGVHFSVTLEQPSAEELEELDQEEASLLEHQQ